MNTRFILLGIILLLHTICTLPVGAQNADADRDTLRVSYAVSGGASLGSYQAGHIWTMVTYKKMANANPDMLRRFTDVKLPYIQLSNIAGSSAGNINGLLSAIEWFKKDIRAPEESIFWKIWGNVGIEQIFPFGNENRKKPFVNAIFHRKYFDSYLKSVLNEELQTDIKPSNHILDIGVTLTKLDPVSLSIDGSEVKTQRFITTYSVSPETTAEGNKLVFGDNVPVITSHMKNNNFGQLIVPEIRGNGEQKLDLVMDISEASSAIPFFFAPVKLKYSHLNNYEDFVQESHFVDGGIFDNRPLDFAIKMHNARYPTVSGEVDSNFVMVYLDINNRRKLDPDLVTKEENNATRGIRSAFRLLNGAFFTARHYELEVLYRNLMNGDSEEIRASSRYGDVVGDFYGALAGFLGKPFRHYDFYSGIYDGLYYVSSRYTELVLGCENNCSNKRAEVMAELYEKLPLSLPARYVIAEHYKKEFDRELEVDSAAFNKLEIAPHINGIFYAFEEYNDELRAYNKLTKSERAEAKKPDMENFIRHFASYSFLNGNEYLSLNDYLQSFTNPRFSSFNTNYSSASPLLDRSYKEVVVDFKEYEKAMYGRFFQQWWRVENDTYQDDEVESNYEFLPEISQFAYYKANPNAKLGFNPSPTIIEENHLRFTQYLLPYVFDINLSNPGFEAGYELYLVKNLLHIPVRPVIRNVNISQALMFRASLGLDVMLSDTFTTGFSVGTQGRYSDDFAEISKFPVNTATLYFDFWNTVRLSGELTDGNLNPLFGDNKPIFNLKLGIIDLNGLLYWSGRIIK